jgi:hypothetical protein
MKYYILTILIVKEIISFVLFQVHRVLSFTQSPWLKIYIDFNTIQRSLATNKFEKDFFKLMNNSMFGKTMENLRKRRKVDLITSEEQLRKRVSQPAFKNFIIFHEDLVAVERVQTNLCLNRPIYIGFAVLDLSKHLMYEFHYKHIKTRYPEGKSRLLFTDTDSLAYGISTDNIYQDMWDDKDLYDFSEYPISHQCHSLDNKKVIGKFKDELAGCIIEEFVGLKAKMYSVKSKNNIGITTEMKKAKGVKTCVVKKKLTHSDYKQCIFRNLAIYKSWTSIRSYNHQLFSINQNKKSLSTYDDKRYILDDGISTLPYGHYRITTDNTIHFSNDLRLLKQ